ncbi:MAG: hypothetical protein H7Z14_21175 [Anaerolineae bacterium]|nr:hypothetical protein [Phycisphaerae bacterium]
MPRTHRRAVAVRTSIRTHIEPLETRRLLCSLHTPVDNPIELRPDLVGARASAVADPADIVWTNRGTATAAGAGDTDLFGARFGTSAPLARAVVDAVIVAFERMVGSFNYSSAGVTYSMSLSMGAAGGGFGASAGISTTFGGKPKSGTVTMGAGSNTANANDDNGWFLDPTPFESSEFLGNIVNAFSGDAQAGSPAAGRGDFYTVVAAEMTHCMGMSSFNPPGWAPRVTNTNIPDTAEGGGVGTFYVFNGPSIKHLLTSNNGGAGGSARATAVHGAGPNVAVNFNGDTYFGAQDHGNAIYEFSRRYNVNKVFSLMYKDAFDYATVHPDKYGTFYSVLNQTTKLVTVRGGTGTNNDTISITRSGNTVSVSVDPTVDVAGTGELPGAGNLPAWVTEYDISQISSITIDGGAGNDTITIAADIGVPISINGGTGTDTITVTEASAAAPVTLINSTGNDTVNVNIDDIGVAEVRFSSTMTLGALNIGNGGFANMLANGSRVLVTNSISVNGSGKLDLNNNDMIVDYTGASALPLVQQLIQVARTGGAWVGAGITSSSARNASPANTTLGVIEATDFKSVYGAAATFDGQTIDDSAVLVKYIYYGDVDFSGVVDFDDYSRVDAGFSGNTTGWFNGDVDLNGVVDFDDYSLIDQAFNTQIVALRPVQAAKPLALKLPRGSKLV